MVELWAGDGRRWLLEEVTGLNDDSLGELLMLWCDLVLQSSSWCGEVSLCSHCCCFGCVSVGSGLLVLCLLLVCLEKKINIKNTSHFVGKFPLVNNGCVVNLLCYASGLTSVKIHTREYLT